MTNQRKGAIRYPEEGAVRRAVWIRREHDKRILDEIESATGIRSPGKVYSYTLNRILSKHFKTN